MVCWMAATGIRRDLAACRSPRGRGLPWLPRDADCGRGKRHGSSLRRPQSQVSIDWWGNDAPSSQRRDSRARRAVRESCAGRVPCRGPPATKSQRQRLGAHASTLTSVHCPLPGTLPHRLPRRSVASQTKKRCGSLDSFPVRWQTVSRRRAWAPAVGQVLRLQELHGSANDRALIYLVPPAEGALSRIRSARREKGNDWSHMRPVP